jgi:hypothetical protein
MQQLWLNSNSLVGTIPNELGRLIAMETFEIEGNNLSGTVPELLCELKQFFSLEKFGADCSALEVRGQAKDICFPKVVKF